MPLKMLGTMITWVTKVVLAAAALVLVLTVLLALNEWIFHVPFGTH